jgi:hypothetical protein
MAAVSERDFHRENHYVPELYLRKWASPDQRLWVYRILVSNSEVPLWRRGSVGGIAYHSHLYTRIAGGRETDEFEKWLDREFETQAEEPLRKATSGTRLTPDDWQRILRFAVAQFVRTPAHLIASLARWHDTMPTMLKRTLETSVRRIEQALAAGKRPASPEKAEADLPIRVTTERGLGQEPGKLKAEVVVGRGLWQFEIRHVLTTTLHLLPTLRWTVLSPPSDMNWITSDDPVVLLNYYGPGSYDFEGGWGNPGSEILLPLGPRHLLYAHVGKRPPQRGEIMPRERAEMIQRFIAEHAHRFVYSCTPDPAVERLRPRRVSAEQWQQERDQWRRWHEDQTNAERELMGVVLPR